MKKKIKQNTNTAGVKYCTADGNVLLQSGQPKRFSKSAALLASAAIILSAALFALGLYFLVDKVDHAAAKADEAILQEKSSEATDIDLANALRTSAADRVVADETIPAYSNAQVRSMDVSKPSGVTEAELKLITKGNLKGLVPFIFLKLMRSGRKLCWQVTVRWVSWFLEILCTKRWYSMIALSTFHGRTRARLRRCPVIRSI